MTTLSQVTIGKLSIGHIVNLASNDVQRFDLVSLNSVNADQLSTVQCMWMYETTDSEMSGVTCVQSIAATPQTSQTTHTHCLQMCNNTFPAIQILYSHASLE